MSDVESTFVRSEGAAHAWPTGFSSAMRPRSGRDCTAMVMSMPAADNTRFMRGGSTGGAGGQCVLRKVRTSTGPEMRTSLFPASRPDRDRTPPDDGVADRHVSPTVVLLTTSEDGGCTYTYVIGGGGGGYARQDVVKTRRVPDHVGVDRQRRGGRGSEGKRDVRGDARGDGGICEFVREVDGRGCEECCGGGEENPCGAEAQAFPAG